MNACPGSRAVYLKKTVFTLSFKQNEKKYTAHPGPTLHSNLILSSPFASILCLLLYCARHRVFICTCSSLGECKGCDFENTPGFELSTFSYTVCIEKKTDLHIAVCIVHLLMIYSVHTEMHHIHVYMCVCIAMVTVQSVKMYFNFKVHKSY